MLSRDTAARWLRLLRSVGRAFEEHVAGPRETTWREFLSQHQPPDPPLFSKACLDRWGDRRWEPSDADRKAADRLHTQLVSRITTQKLSYLTGVEKTALDSVYSLFEKTRTIVDEGEGCRHFGTLAWDVLNNHVRHFTAKWHKHAESGALAALDTTDEFRAELERLRGIFLRFDEFLLHLRDGRRPHGAAEPGNPREAAIEKDIKDHVLAWGISEKYGGLDPGQAKDIKEAERKAILRRRARNQPQRDARFLADYNNREHAVALALSGGGIRSATFSLGVLVALAGRNILPQFDYLSTVSGGGYLGAFLSAFLNSPGGDEIGLRSTQLPFSRRDGEAKALRHIRHRSKYLATGSVWQHAAMIAAQLYGMVLNTLAIVYLLAVAVFVERWIRSLSILEGHEAVVKLVTLTVFLACALAALAILRFDFAPKRLADRAVLYSLLLYLAVVVWYGLPYLLLMPQWTPPRLKVDIDKEGPLWLVVSGAIPLVASALAGVFGRVLKRTSLLLLALSVVATPVFFFGLYVVLSTLAARGIHFTLPIVGELTTLQSELLVVLGGGAIYFLLLNINATSPHRHYRDKLSEAFVIQPGDRKPFESDVPIRLSDLGKDHDRAPYHLINAALNVPGSPNQALQGRLTDFFLFSPAFCGSPITGYFPTRQWEEKDDHLDLGTAMAISAAAAAPQMGLGTVSRASFWLALLNVRLGYWLRRPDRVSIGPPGLLCLLHEMRGSMRETHARLNVTDGGHIENLGVYELLRRRCKYIVSIDGEEDARMTFHALTTLQRLAYIDFGINIDIDLDDLRLSEKGLSRSHFKFCRIRYPKEARGSEEEFGYLLYVKLSLTGNEGEFLRRYRLDEPAFPHHSTADQFFGEAQYEAYRSLGEHIGDRLFLPTMVGDEIAKSSEVIVEEWFLALARSLLDHPPPTTRSPKAP